MIHIWIMYALYAGKISLPTSFNRYIRNINASLRNYTISNLLSDTSYTIEIQAVNADFRGSTFSLYGRIRTLPPD